MGDEIMSISIRALCWQAQKSIPVTLCECCLFKKNEKKQIKPYWIQPSGKGGRRDRDKGIGGTKGIT